MSRPTHLNSITKAFTWRAVGAIDTFFLAYLITGHAGAASSIMGLEVFTKSFLYYSHERVWATGRDFVWIRLLVNLNIKILNLLKREKSNAETTA
jgi:uncharacterized membrane protein